jgi:hypothetical protein
VEVVLPAHDDHDHEAAAASRRRAAEHHDDDRVHDDDDRHGAFGSRSATAEAADARGGHAVPRRE